MLGSGETCCVCMDTPGFPWIHLHLSAIASTAVSENVDCCSADDTTFLL